MRCTKCGCENPGYAVVCEQCGEFLPRVDLTASVKPDGSVKTSEREERPELTAEELFSKSEETTELTTEKQVTESEERPEPAAEEQFAEREEEPEPTVTGYVPENAEPVPHGMIRCRNCWTNNPRGVTHCAGCGKELRSIETRASAEESYDTLRKMKNAKIICVNCGAEVPWSAMTCSGCGKHPRVSQPEYVEEDEDSPLIALIDLITNTRR